MSKGFNRYHYLHQNQIICIILVANDADKPIVMQINGICLKLPNMVLNVHINIWQSKYCF